MDRMTQVGETRPLGRGLALAVALLFLVPGAVLLQAALASRSDAASALQEPFTEIALPEALEQACAEGKVVVLAFHESSPDGWQRLAHRFWSDPLIVEWVERAAIALDVEIASDPVLAGRFRVRDVPTVVFLNAHGEEIGQISYYPATSRWVQEAWSIVARNQPYQPPQLEFTGDWNAPMERGDFADELVKAGLYERALEHYLWCWDESLEHSPSYVGVRGSFLLSDLRDLARVHPAAGAAMDERREATRRQLLDASTPADTLHRYGMDLRALDRSFYGSPERSLEVYDALRERGDELATAREALRRMLGDQFLESQRYADVLEDVTDPAPRYRRMVARVIRSQEVRARRAGSHPVDLSWITRTGLTWFEASVGTGQLDQAQDIAEAALGLAPTDATYAALVQSALRAGSASLASEYATLARSTLALDDRVLVEAAATGIP